MSTDLWFSGWEPLLRTLITGLVAYPWLIIILRITGKRTLSKLNAFDLIVTVALGSTLASVITSQSISIVQGMLALAMLVVFQLAVTFVSVRWSGFNRAVKAEPTVLLSNGQMLVDAMRRERVTEDELLSATRQAGAGNLASARAILLETDGSLSVILKD